MRHVIAIALLACSTPRAQPGGPVLMEDDGYEPPPRRTISVDAGVEDAAIDAPADAAIPVDAPPDSNVTLENGVPVIKITDRVWCATRGRWKGACWDDLAVCRKRFKSPCRLTAAVACFSLTDRLSGKESPFCFADFGMCEQFADMAESDPNVASLTDCFVVRYEEKK